MSPNREQAHGHTGARPALVGWIVAGIAVGFVVGVVPESTYAWNHKSGIWNLVQKLPTPFGRSPVIVVLSTIGGGVAGVAFARLAGRQRLVMAAALLGFAIVQCANAAVWQRYYEPFCLIWLALAAGEPADERSMTALRRRFAVGGLLTLTFFQLAVAVYTLRAG